jgi:ComF family protein
MYCQEMENFHPEPRRPFFTPLLIEKARVGWRRASDFLFPPTCPGCGRVMAEHGALCQACWRDVSFIECPYCEVLGTPFEHDLGAGFLSAEAIANPPVFDHLRAVCLFDGAARNLVHGLKYRDRTELAPMMARWMARAGAEGIDDCDVILPVPLHRWRLFSRRFNQAADLARALAVETGKPMLPNALRRRRRTAQQVGLGKAAREANMKGAFEVTGEGKAALLGKRVLLIDDVYTTGATVSAATRALKRAGVTKVDVLTFAMAFARHGAGTI